MGFFCNQIQRHFYFTISSETRIYSFLVCETRIYSFLKISMFCLHNVPLFVERCIICSNFLKIVELVAFGIFEHLSEERKCLVLLNFKRQQSRNDHTLSDLTNIAKTITITLLQHNKSWTQCVLKSIRNLDSCCNIDKAFLC